MIATYAQKYSHNFPRHLSGDVNRAGQKGWPAKVARKKTAAEYRNFLIQVRARGLRSLLAVCLATTAGNSGT